MPRIRFQLVRVRWRPWALASALFAVLWMLPQTALHSDTGDAGAGSTRAASRVAQPFLWRIALEPPSYLFGTIHLPDERVLDLPESVAAALREADVVYTEIPMDVGTQIQVQQRLLLEDGATLESVLPQELYRRLEAHVERSGAPLFLLRRLKVWAVATLLPLLEWSRGQGSNPALDQWIADRAVELGKTAAALETVDSQIAAMESMGAEGEITLLRQTLDYLEEARRKGEDPIERLLLVYLTGDEQKLTQISREQFDAGGELAKRVEEVLVLRRNETLTDTIQRRLKQQPDRSHFFAVGALHYPGPRGIVALLRARGFKVDRVQAASAPVRRSD